MLNIMLTLLAMFLKDNPLVFTHGYVMKYQAILEKLNEIFVVDWK